MRGLTRTGLCDLSLIRISTLIHQESFAVTAGTYDVEVGLGGTGGGFNATSRKSVAGNGGNSSIFGRLPVSE